MATRRWLATVTAAVAAGMPVLLPAAPADAITMISAPQPRLTVGREIQVGVWYRAWDGGGRTYRVRVLNPAGRVVFSQHGKAPTHWRMWHVRTHRTGVWRTIYLTKDYDGSWIRSVFRTRVHR